MDPFQPIFIRLLFLIFIRLLFNASIKRKKINFLEKDPYYVLSDPQNHISCFLYGMVNPKLYLFGLTDS